ncbi:hypothetical protein [Plantactinospora sp. GCM10030261]|uniref:hypothetical protein n=1 Tax=Plantactinospora sp. GCM10030261 TaxID=3273420 RepID=UPI00361D8077
MKITEEGPGEWIAVADMPLTPTDLTELAGALPDGAHCTDIQHDENRVWMTWEVETHRVVPID